MFALGVYGLIPHVVLIALCLAALSHDPAHVSRIWLFVLGLAIVVPVVAALTLQLMRP